MDETPFRITKQNFLPIKKWDRKDRPREKLLSGTMSDMSDAELLSILIGCGTEELSALDIAHKILSYFNGNLLELSCRSPKELIRKFSGIGEARAVSIMAGIELGKRSLDRKPDAETLIQSSEVAFRFLAKDLSSSPYEKFFALLLSQSGRLIRKVCISEGGLAATTVDARKLFKYAIDEHCSGIILAHNHPSGNLQPSREDAEITQKLAKGARLLDLRILDHLIIKGNRYFSFSDRNLLP